MDPVPTEQCLPFSHQLGLLETGTSNTSTANLRPSASPTIAQPGGLTRSRVICHPWAGNRRRAEEGASVDGEPKRWIVAFGGRRTRGRCRDIFWDVSSVFGSDKHR